MMRRERYIPMDYNRELLEAVNEFMISVKIHFYVPQLVEGSPIPTCKEMDNLLSAIEEEIMKNAKPLIKY